MPVSQKQRSRGYPVERANERMGEVKECKFCLILFVKRRSRQDYCDELCHQRSRALVSRCRRLGIQNPFSVLG